MAELRIVRLASQHDRSSFDCGHPFLDNWLKRNAGQFDRRDLARTFVATWEDEVRVLGYYSMSNHHVTRAQMSDDESRGLPNIDIPMLLLGRLAVDRVAQGQGLGKRLLLDALSRSRRIADEIGIRGLEVHAIDDRAADFYRHYGFRSFQDDDRHLFIAISAIRKLNL
ncbi:MAG: GNAT family N-acetyltransferase [Bryobacteraceae bacterium]|nr:GNAT family N-acetyltransferase [Planctomycetia bacterium]MDZ4802696.1 GNAT family N-acetyltransferase [Bryobacteraceae bacterium]